MIATYLRKGRSYPHTRARSVVVVARPARIKYLLTVNRLPIQYKHIRHSPRPRQQWRGIFIYRAFENRSAHFQNRRRRVGRAATTSDDDRSHELDADTRSCPSADIGRERTNSPQAGLKRAAFLFQLAVIPILQSILHVSFFSTR
jgi:hypothetical protein